MINTSHVHNAHSLSDYYTTMGEVQFSAVGVLLKKIFFAYGEAVPPAGQFRSGAPAGSDESEISPS